MHLFEILLKLAAGFEDHNMKIIWKPTLAALVFLAVSCSTGTKSAPYWGEESSWYMNEGSDTVDVFYLVSTNVLSAQDDSGKEVYRALLTDEDRAVMGQEMEFVHSHIFGDGFNFFSPIYHQFTMRAIRLPEQEFKAEFSEVSKEVCDAFDWYMEHWNNGRRFILAGFSQGAMLTLELLRHMSDEQYGRMVAAYALGYRLSEEDLECPHIKAAQGESDTQVVVSFNTVLSEDGIWPLVSGNAATCINPVSWSTDTTKVDFLYTEADTTMSLSVSINEQDNVLYVSGGEEFFRNWMDRSFFSTASVSHDCLHHWDILLYDAAIHDNALTRCRAGR